MNECKDYDEIKKILVKMRNYFDINNIKYSFIHNYNHINFEYWSSKIYISLFKDNDKHIKEILKFTSDIEQILDKKNSDLKFGDVGMYAEDTILEIVYAIWYDDDNHDEWYSYNNEF